MTTIESNDKSIDEDEEIKKLNELFAKRYTDKDDDYNLMSKRSNSPPIVDNWSPERHTPRPRQYDDRNQRPYPSNNNQQQYRSYSHNRDRHRDDFNNQQSYRNYSNDRRHNRNDSNSNRDYRDRSPIHHHKRR